ncbi:cytochrome c3 family protein [Lutibacter sp. HS1-25]|uniref:cytochrome c3 family protein n=1 Tax=Lutibacter sp. HS1-25 TaxID=2485000 RepID=UPI0010112330|nr:cytochrome c3 family protein [Lutibacter sp. HS1-25]
MKRGVFRIGIFTLILMVSVVLFFLLKNEKSLLSENSAYKTLKVASKESCLQCHQNTKGYANYHNPDLIGCSSCHLGNINSTEKEISHKGMVLIPGNLIDAKETCGKCHPNELRKIENSLMTTNSGLVAVDKFIFGEADSPNYQYHIQLIKNSPADKHIRDLCANCHLGADKKEFGAITQLSRGGGCNACHLNYSDEAKKDLETYIASNKKRLPTNHPATNIFVKNEHCFGCHSRSSRISTNYEGWQETLLDENEVLNKKGFKVFEDKRVYKYIEEDVHHKKGLLCVDCHSSHEVMGDGKKYTHEEQAVKLQCADCHFKEKPNTIPYDSLDAESLLVFLHRDYKHSDKQIISVKNDGHPLVNTFVNKDGNAFLIGKGDGQLHQLKPQSEICSRDNAHKNVSCATCHSSWTSRCIGCHNEFDKDEPRAFDLLDKKYGKGQWKEYVSEFSSSLPAMGVRENAERKHIEPAVPGMILTIDKGSYVGKEIGTDVSFHRLYAPNSPHTTVLKARDCKSCHTNSTALGYGNGKLKYEIKNGVGQWQFTPEYELNTNDHLPEDAWIPFLKPVKKGVVNSTRTDFRPFSVKEQQQLLLVGACLQCHKEDGKVMQQTLVEGIEPFLKKLNEKCILPTWK